MNTENSQPSYACSFKAFILESEVKTISCIIGKWPQILVKSAHCSDRTESCNEWITAQERRNKDAGDWGEAVIQPQKLWD